ncbi:hypothetical protein L208DRAFT_1252172, partial [Tricholoma matsutake]
DFRGYGLSEVWFMGVSTVSTTHISFNNLSKTLAAAKYFCHGLALINFVEIFVVFIHGFVVLQLSF